MAREYEFEAPMMGATLSVSIISQSDQEAASAFARMQDIARAYEERFSRFRGGSELSELNRRGTLRVSPEFMEIIELGRRLYRQSHSAFNPLVDISRFGYDEDIAVVRGNDRRRAAPALYDTAFETTRVNSEAQTVTLMPGQRLDVGGYLKGFVAERMAREAMGSGVIVNLGGDFYTRGKDAEGSAFQFVIDNPVTGNAIPFTYADGAVATSGTYARHWTLHGTPMHHILRGDGTAPPETDIVSATVCAAHGADADAFATAAVVLGSEKGSALLTELGLAYCLITAEGALRTSTGFPSHPSSSYAG